MSALTLTRRTAIAGAAAFAAAPFAAANEPTPIDRLWIEAQRLDGALAMHRGEIAAAEELRHGAAPGWMYLSSEGREIGEQRYQTLVAILNEKPRHSGDVATMARVAEDRDMRAGPRAWAAERVASAALAMA